MEAGPDPVVLTVNMFGLAKAADLLIMGLLVYLAAFVVFLTMAMAIHLITSDGN